jgi:hypothetical protein
MGRLLPLLTVLALSACAYDPPIATDHSAQKYVADLNACRDSVGAKVDLEGRATFPRFLISPFTGPPRKRTGIRDCMIGKGYMVAPS